MSTIQQAKRVDYIDIAKGIGILLVIVGHAFRDEMWENSAISAFLGEFVYFFHMPLFFAISGLTFGMSFRKYLKTPALYVKKKITTQLVPVVAYATAIYLCFFVAYQIPALKGMLSTAGYGMHSYLKYLALCAVHDNPYAIHLWYLWVLFLISTVAFLYFRLASNSRRADIYFAAGTLGFFTLATFVFITPITHKLFVNSFYFALGILLSSRQQRLFEKSKTANIAAMIAWLFVLAYCALQAFGYNFRVLNQPQIRAGCKLFANTFIIYSVLKLSRKLGSCKPLLYLGKESYSIYLLHQPFCCGLVGVILYNTLQWPAIVVYILCFALSIAFPAAVVAICRKVKPLGKLAKVLFNIA